MAKYTTGQYPIRRTRGYLTIKSTAIRYLYRNIDPRDNLLVFLWGNYGQESGPHWLVSIAQRSSLPEEAASHGVAGTLLENIPYLVVQAEHAAKLDGRTLVCEAGVLTVR